MVFLFVFGVVLMVSCQIHNAKQKRGIVTERFLNTMIPTHSTRWNRKKCIEKWHNPVPGKGTMHETSLFLLGFLKVGP